MSDKDTLKFLEACCFGNLDALASMKGGPHATSSLVLNIPNSKILYGAKLAGRRNHWNVVRFLLLSPSVTSYTSIKNRVNAFFILCCQEGDFDIVCSLFSNHETREHVDIQAKNSQAFTKACRNGHLNIVLHLLPFLEQSAVEIYTTLSLGLAEAAKQGHREISDVLLKAYEKALRIER